jgi:glycosyltransferase involved in cell wall biosynthesis
MSVFNGAEYLREAIESILMQTFTDFDFIIIDDGSTDETWETLTEYAERDKRIALFQNRENIGLTRSLNKGLKQAQGMYIARQDADDVSLPQRLEREVQFLDENGETALVSSNVEIIDEMGRTLSITDRACDPDLVAWWMLFYNHVAGHSAVLFRRKNALEAGGYDPSVNYAQDYDLWLRLLEQGDLAVLPEVLLRWRLHDDNVSVVAAEEQRRFALRSARKAIGELAGEKPSWEEMSALARFWRPSDFRSPKDMETTNGWLLRIVPFFLRQRCRNGSDQAVLETRIKKAIEGQFWLWFKKVSLLRLPLFKLYMAARALQWKFVALGE